MDRGTEILGLRHARALIAGALALATLAACAPTAWGQPIPVKGGEARLVLDGGFTKVLRQDGVAIKPLGAAKLKGSRLTLAVKRGSFEPDASAGSFALTAGLKLVAGARTVALRQLELDAATKTLSAKLGGRRIALARIGEPKLERDGFDARLRAKRLPLTRAGAAKLSQLLGLPGLLRAGSSLGRAEVLGEATEVAIGFGNIAIGGPETTFSKLESIGVQMGIWGGTQVWSAPGERYFLFEVLPTRLPPDASSGLLEGAANDGVTMQIHQAPPREMLMLNPRLDLGSRELSATLSNLAKDSPVSGVIATLDYGPATLQIRPKVGAFELMKIRAVATQFAADQLNQRFATPGMFQAGETLATITVTLHAG